MATTPKPGNKPEWATVIAAYGGKVNAIAPAGGLVPEGDKYGLPPVRNVHNWLWHYVGEWVDYLEAYTDAAQKCATFTVAAEDASDAWKQTADYVVPIGANAAIWIELAVANLPATGGRVLLSEGTFTGTEIDIVKPGVWVQGQGPNTRVVTAAPGNVAAFNVAAIYCHITDLLITTDAGAGGASYANGIIGTGCNDLVIERVIVEGMHGGPSVLPATPKGVAFYATGSSGQIIGCRVEHVSGGAIADRSGEAVFLDTSKFSVEGCRFIDDNWAGGPAPTSPCVYINGSDVGLSNNIMDYMDFGVLVEGTGNVSVKGNSIRNMVTAGVKALTGTFGLRVEGNQINDSVDGIVLEDATFATAEGNQIDTMSQYGIHMSGFGGRMSAINNTMRACTTAGIVMDDLEKSRVSGNAIYNTSSGILMLTTPAYCVVADNLLQGITGSGIILLGTKHQVSGNVIEGIAGTDGINIRATFTNVEGNQIESFADGIGTTSPATKGSIVGNKISVSAGDGIQVDTGEGWQINDNHVTASTVNAIAIFGAGIHFCQINGNQIDDAVNGIWVEGQSASVVGNSIRSCSGSHIHLASSCTASDVLSNSLHAGTGVSAVGIEQVGDSLHANLISGNRMIGAATIELLVEQAAALPIVNCLSLPQAVGGAAGTLAGIDARDNNYMTYASFAFA